MLPRCGSWATREQARDELRRLLPELAQVPAPPAIIQGRFRYHLALCQWRLGDREAAQREAEESLRAYAQESDKDAVPTEMTEQTQQLLGDLKANKSPPPLPKVDIAAALKKPEHDSRRDKPWPSCRSTSQPRPLSINSSAPPSP